MSDASHLLSDDHLNLITSAAARWSVLTSPAAAAFSLVESCTLNASTTQAGRALRAENAAAVAWLSAHGRSRPGDRLEPVTYQHQPVPHPLRPVEVIKAAHAAEALCSDSPSWASSFASRLLAGVLRAACHRLEGYAQAPWHWTRPERRSGAPVAVGGRWRPRLPGVIWIDPGELAQHWEGATLVLITAEVAQKVPAGLSNRAGVFVLTGEQPADEVWHAVMALGLQTLVLFWPTCQPWLLAQVTDPDVEFIEHR